MDGLRGPLAAVSDFVHRRLIWLVLASYALAAVAPAAGRWAVGASLGDLTLLGERVRVTPPALLLAVLLFNAGLGVQPARLRGLLRRPAVLLAGLAANLTVPLACVFAVAQLLRPWHNWDEAQQILVGLGLVASMPVAGSSTAWSQHADGDPALSLGLVLASTLLSPWTTPAALYAVGLAAGGGYAADLHALAGSGAGLFVTLWVALPSLLGLLARPLLGDGRVAAAGPHRKLVNALLLLALNYANASASLPQAAAERDWDFLAVLLGAVAGLCLLLFAAGWWVGRLAGADRAGRTALMFGLGMNNNGTGLVLAAALAAHPAVLLPIICYNLAQHLAAAAASAVVRRAPAAPAG